MVYIISAVVIILILIIYFRFSIARARKNAFEKIRNDWGKPKGEEFNFHLIGKYSNIVRDYDSYKLSDQTIDDIDLYELFAFIDRTSSRTGQQYLFANLLQPSTDYERLGRLEEKINLFTSNVPVREEIQKELVKLTSKNAYHIPSLLQDKLIEKPEWVKFLFLSNVTILSLLLFSIKFPVLLIFLMIPIVVNMMVHYWNKSNAYQFAASFPELSILINVSESIRKSNNFFESQEVEKSGQTLKAFQRKLRLINLGDDGGVKGELDQIGSHFLELIKGFFLVEVLTFFSLIKELEQKKNSISILFNYVGEIDTAISTASLRSGSLSTCKPAFIDSRKEIIIRNTYHPLIKDCVKNDLSIKSKSVLITGSNMSGKTTFLRTLIINSLLAQTINTCFADEFVTPFLKSYSSIRINDNLLEGKSLYFEEVSIVGTLIEKVNSPDQNFFILDEVFKGTNTIERIAAAKAILSYLNKDNNIVVVSTHDIELAKLLESEYDLYHFTETIEEETLHFDHKLKPGQLKTRNAIRVLEIAAYPKEVIEEAKNLSALLDKS